MSRGVIVSIAAIGVLVGIGTVAPLAVLGGQSVSFPRVEIDATVEQDGSLLVDERRTIDFRGDFTFGFYTLDWPQPLIEDFAIREGGTEILGSLGPSDTGGFRADFPFFASDEVRTLRVTYRARCAVDVYQDTAHLFWQFIGTGWDAPTDLAEVTVHLPGGAVRRPGRPPACPAPQQSRTIPTEPLGEGDVRAWGHGPFQGEVQITDPQTVAFSVRDVPAKRFVEGSILFPLEAVPLAAIQQIPGPSYPEELTRALAGGRPMREAILAYEAGLAREANELRAAHRRETTIVKILFGLVPAILIALVVIARRRDRVPGVSKVLEEPPEEIHPVELTLLWSTSRKRLASRTAYRAQFLHLVNTGVIDVRAVGLVSAPEDFEVRRLQHGDGFDDEFADFLFAENGDGPVRLKDVRMRGERRDLLGDWWKEVGKKTKRHIKKISAGKGRLEWIAALLVGIGAAVYGFWRWTGFEEGFEPLGLVGTLAAWLIPVGVLGFLITGRLIPLRLPDRVRGRMARWAAFRRFLKTFSRLDEAPTLAVRIWEHYLTYAVALEVADEVEKQVKALVPVEELPEPWPGGPRGFDGYHVAHHVRHSTATHTPAAAAAAVGFSSGTGSSSSGGGGGGGFSGGGGGGGGGSGGGFG